VSTAAVIGLIESCFGRTALSIMIIKTALSTMTRRWINVLPAKLFATFPTPAAAATTA